MKYPFTEAESKKAHDEWGANCGPNALAFALQMPLEPMRHAIPGFEEKRYTSPTMMKAALEFFGRSYSPVKVPRWTPGRPIDIEKMYGLPALVRVQWTGPWTDPGANARWAYGHTHWITTWEEKGPDDIHPRCMLFDVNGGIRGHSSWEEEIVPILTNFPRCTREWFPTHIWRLHAQK